MKRLVVDDIRVFTFDAKYVRTVKEAIALLSKDGNWDEVWLDHDMGSMSADVDVLANWLEEKAFAGEVLPIGEFIVHTANSVGRQRIIAALDKFYPVRSVNAADYVFTFDDSNLFKKEDQR